jgi:hypothetical protein
MVGSSCVHSVSIGLLKTGGPASRYRYRMSRHVRPEPMPYWAGCIILLLAWAVVRLIWIRWFGG